MSNSPASPLRSRHPFVWVISAAGLVAVAATLFAGAVLLTHGSVRKASGWQAAREGESFVVTSVDPRGPAAGRLEPGDRLIALNGDPRVAEVGPGFLFRTLPAGRCYALSVRRKGAQRLETLKLEDVPRSGGELGYLASLLVVGGAFVATSLVIGLSRPDEPIVRLGAISLLLAALTIIRTTLSPFLSVFTGFESAIFFWIPNPNPVHLAVAHSFYVRFPPGVRRERLLRWLDRFLLLLGSLLYVAQEIEIRIRFQVAPFAGSSLRRLFPALLSFISLDNPFSILAFAAICVAIVRNFRVVKEPDERRRMRWIAYGSLAGISPWLAYLVASTAFAGMGLAGGAFDLFLLFLNRFANLALLVVPVTTGTAIVKHRLFDIHVVVRQGLQYLFARNVLRLALAIPVGALVLRLVSERDRTVGEILFHNSGYFYLLVLLTAGLIFRRRMRGWLDRRFFREEYDRERILIGLSEDISKLDSLSEISRLVSRELEAALHPKVLYVFERERERGSQVLAYSSGQISGATRIADDSILLKLMEGEDAPRDILPGKPSEIPAQERGWLEEMGVTLLVPMSGGDGRLAGLLLLGEKRSEEPYGAKDRKLLQAIARQMAIVHENSALKERVEKDKRFQREVLSRLDEASAFAKECPRCGRCFDGSEVRCVTDGAELEISVPVTRTLEGRYRLEWLIGKGGMGAVYEATDLRLGRSVAVKIVFGHLVLDRAAARRFEREARASAKLNHPNIISVHDYGTLGSDGAFLVMEYVRGVTLRTEIKRNGRLEPRLAALWFDQILEGVKAAHAAGVVHRDLKPENVLIGKSESGKTLLKILDFGLAKMTLLDLSEPDSLTLPGTVLGTVGYMSPEQVSGGELDSRTDIFSLAILVIEALTGRLPFKGPTLREMMLSTLNDTYRLPGGSSEARTLDTILQRCLEKEPAKRYGSISELQAVLIPALANVPAFPSVEIESGEHRTRPM